MSNGFHRSDLQNGDLLAWHKTSSPNKSFDYLDLVRILTMSDFGHVSTVWKENNLPFHVEAAMPKITRVLIPTNAEIYVIPLGLNVSDDVMDIFFHDKIGLDYSIYDAWCGLVGWRLSDEKRYQCAELKNEFLRYMGINIGNAYTPGRVVTSILDQTGLPLMRLNN